MSPGFVLFPHRSQELYHFNVILSKLDLILVTQLVTMIKQPNLAQYYCDEKCQEPGKVTKNAFLKKHEDTKVQMTQSR